MNWTLPRIGMNFGEIRYLHVQLSSALGAIGAMKEQYEKDSMDANGAVHDQDERIQNILQENADLREMLMALRQSVKEILEDQGKKKAQTSCFRVNLSKVTKWFDCFLFCRQGARFEVTQ